MATSQSKTTTARRLALIVAAAAAALAGVPARAIGSSPPTRLGSPPPNPLLDLISDKALGFASVGRPIAHPPHGTAPRRTALSRGRTPYRLGGTSLVVTTTQYRVVLAESHSKGSALGGTPLRATPLGSGYAAFATYLRRHQRQLLRSAAGCRSRAPTSASAEAPVMLTRS